MKRIHYLPMLIVLVILGAPAISLAHRSMTNDRDENDLQPIRTGSCLVEGKFSCQEYEYTYGVRGVSCTEDCLALSRLNTCQITNRCHWDPSSGCFRKEICVDLSVMNTCRRWNTQAICR